MGEEEGRGGENERFTPLFYLLEPLYDVSNYGRKQVQSHYVLVNDIIS